MTCTCESKMTEKDFVTELKHLGFEHPKNHWPRSTYEKHDIQVYVTNTKAMLSDGDGKWHTFENILATLNERFHMVTEKRMPTDAEIEEARRQINEEDKKQEGLIVEYAENRRRNHLPSEHPEHICGVMCDGQDGYSSYCARIRRKLFPDD